MLSENAPEDRVVVAVDFGTTFSGVATVYSATPDEVDIIRTWPGTVELLFSDGNGSMANFSSQAAMESQAIKCPRRYRTS